MKKKKVFGFIQRQWLSGSTKTKNIFLTINKKSREKILVFKKRFNSNLTASKNKTISKRQSFLLGLGTVVGLYYAAPVLPAVAEDIWNKIELDTVPNPTEIISTPSPQPVIVPLPGGRFAGFVGIWTFVSSIILSTPFLVGGLIGISGIALVQVLKLRKKK
jgi:hypothetical protein